MAWETGIAPGVPMRRRLPGLCERLYKLPCRGATWRDVARRGAAWRDVARRALAHAAFAGRGLEREERAVGHALGDLAVQRAQHDERGQPDEEVQPEGAEDRGRLVVGGVRALFQRVDI